MKYYLFDYACATKETGSQYPQIQKMSVKYDYNANNSVSKLSRCINDFPNFEPNLNSFILHKSAKASDLLSSAPLIGSGFIISEKLKNIFEKFKLPTHKNYPAKIIQKENIYNYYWIHIICDLTDYIDYGKSEFYITHLFKNIQDIIHIDSKNELISKREELKKKDIYFSISPIKIYFIDDYLLNFDLFYISLFDFNFYASQNLKNVIYEENITGIELTESNKFTE